RICKRRDQEICRKPGDDQSEVCDRARRQVGTKLLGCGRAELPLRVYCETLSSLQNLPPLRRRTLPFPTSDPCEASASSRSGRGRAGRTQCRLEEIPWLSSMQPS